MMSSCASRWLEINSSSVTTPVSSFKTYLMRSIASNSAKYSGNSIWRVFWRVKLKVSLPHCDEKETSNIQSRFWEFAKWLNELTMDVRHLATITTEQHHIYIDIRRTKDQIKVAKFPLFLLAAWFNLWKLQIFVHRLKLPIAVRYSRGTWFTLIVDSSLKSGSGELNPKQSSDGAERRGKVDDMKGQIFETFSAHDQWLRFQKRPTLAISNLVGSNQKLKNYEIPSASRASHAAIARAFLLSVRKMFRFSVYTIVDRREIVSNGKWKQRFGL